MFQLFFLQLNRTYLKFNSFNNYPLKKLTFFGFYERLHNQLTMLFRSKRVSKRFFNCEIRGSLDHFVNPRKKRLFMDHDVFLKITIEFLNLSGHNLVFFFHVSKKKFREIKYLFVCFFYCSIKCIAYFNAVNFVHLVKLFAE